MVRIPGSLHLLRVLTGSPREGSTMITSHLAKKIGVVPAVIGLVAVGFAFLYAPGQAEYGATSGPGATTTAPTPVTSPAADSVDLTDSQLSSVKVEPVGEREFPIEKQAVGSIDFNENMTLQVFTPYQGRLIALFAEVGGDVEKGNTLFTVASPDLLQAEQTIIAAAGVLELTTRNLARLKELYATRAISQKDLEQAASDQQTAEGALRAARDSVRLFGKTEAEIDEIIAQRKADPTLVVPSPITGRITARNAAPGLLVQPGNPPAPYSVADVDTMWMLANVAEADSPAFRVGQEVKVKLNAFPGREVKDPNHELRSGMFGNFVIRIGDPMRSVAVPLAGVVREGDGTETVWVTADRRRFTHRTVKLGLQHEGYRQILEGLQPGELVATEGAIFLSNLLRIARGQ